MSRFKARIRKKLVNSSLHGLPHIFQTKKLLAKIVWARCWLFGAALTTILIINSINEYLAYNVTTNSHITDNYRVTFPKVTICNLDPFTTNASLDFLAYLIRNQSLESNLNSIFSSNLEMVNYFIRNEKTYDFKGM